MLSAAGKKFSEGYSSGNFSNDNNEEMEKLHANPWILITSSLVINILSLALPIMLLQIYDRIIPNSSYGTLSMLIAGVGIALILEGILRILRSYITGWAASYYEHIATCQALKHLTGGNLGAIEKEGTATHLQRFAALLKLREFYSGQMLLTVVDLPFAAVYLALVIYLGKWLALVPALLVVAFILFAFHIGNRFRDALDKRSDADDNKLNFLYEALSGIHGVKSLALEGQMLRRFEHYQKDCTDNNYNVSLEAAHANILGDIFMQLATTLTVVCGSILVISGVLSVGGLAACTLLAGRVIQPVQKALGSWTRFQEFKVAKKLAGEIFEIPKIHYLPFSGLLEPRGAIELENVSFAYGAELEPILENINLQVKPGETIAIMGEKGVGKTTLLNLLLGTLKSTSGTLMLDGFDPAVYDNYHLRGHIGYLPQKGTFFRGTVIDNLTNFRKEQNIMDSAMQVARELGFINIINSLPGGFATYLSDGPADPVAPGVKQRICIGRALVDRPKIILFDDADRALDKEGYNRIFKFIGRLKGECTIIMASEDKNLLSFADRFLVLDKAGLTEAKENYAAKF